MPVPFFEKSTFYRRLFPLALFVMLLMWLPPVSMCSRPAMAEEGANQASEAPIGKKTVILVHGEFEDGSVWSRVISLLQARKVNVLSVQIPLTSLADDVSVVRRAIERQNEPVILVGHSWGGSVITQIGNHKKVAALVYVAAFAPSEGETSLELARDYPTTPGFSTMAQDKDGFLSLTVQGFLVNFAPELANTQKRILASVQGPIASRCFAEKLTAIAWREKPSWYVIAGDDRMIEPKLQTAFAKRMGATVQTVDSSHVPMLSHPREITTVILEALNQSR